MHPSILPVTSRMVACVVLSVSFTAIAQDLAPTPPRTVASFPSILEGTATHTSNKATHLRQHPLNSGEFFSHYPHTLVHSSRWGGSGLTVRGLTGARNKLIVDGIRFDNTLFPTMPHPYLSIISPHAVEQGRLIQGPLASTRNNPGGGSALHLDTHLPIKPPLGFSSTGGYTHSSAAHGHMINADGYLSAVHFTAHGGADFIGKGETRVGGGSKAPFSDYQRANWRLSLAMEPQDSPITVTGTYMGHLTMDAASTDRLHHGNISMYDTNDTLVIMAIDWNERPLLRELGIRAAYHRWTETATHLHCPVRGGKYQVDPTRCIDIQDARHGIRYTDTVDTFTMGSSFKLRPLQNRLSLGGHINYTYDAVNSQGDQISIASGAPNWERHPRGRYSSGSYDSSLHATLEGEVAILDTAAGQLSTRLGAGIVAAAAYAPVIPGIEEDIHNSNVGGTNVAALAWDTPGAFSIWGAFSHGFRSPSLHETTTAGYSQSVFIVPQTELKPETSLNKEIGIEMIIAPVTLTVRGFHNTIIDYIDQRPATWRGLYTTDSNTTVVTHENAHRAIIKGISQSFDFSLWHLHFNSHITWQQGTVYDDTTGYFARLTANGDAYPTMRTPSWMGGHAIRYECPRRRAYSEIRFTWAAEQSDLHPLDRLSPSICKNATPNTPLNTGCTHVPGYYTINLQGGIRITPNARIELMIANLTDQLYTPVGSAVPAAGIDGRGTLYIDF